MKRTILTLTMVVASSVCSQSFGFDLLDRMLGMKGCGSSSSCCEAPIYDNACCEPACGVESTACGTTCCEPACGAESHGGLLFGHGKRGPGCGFENNCCETACSTHCEPACGAETACCEPACCDSHCGAHKKSCCNGLLGKLFNKNRSTCCEAPTCCEPACGCEIASCGPTSCDSGCCSTGQHRGGLLTKLFGRLSCCKHKSNCCDMGCDTGCGCGSSIAAPYAAPVQAPNYEQSAPMPPAPIVDPNASISRNRRVIQASASYAR